MIRHGLLRHSSLACAQRTMSSATSSPNTPLRLVLFDVFDTLCTPRKPIHEQYYEEAIKAGVSSTSISPESVRSGFRPAFKSMETEFPLYGKQSEPPLSPESWWSELIRRCIREAGADEAEVERCKVAASAALLRRFESRDGYVDFPETIQTLMDLKALGVKTSVVSNADPRILKTLEALSILPLLSHPPTLSWGAEAAKPSAEIFRQACAACQEDIGPGVMMVGDELKADYHGAKDAGLEARLIRRNGEWSDGATRQAGEDLTDVRTINKLTEVVEEVRRRNAID